jgi:hypothetical protein
MTRSALQDGSYAAARSVFDAHSPAPREGFCTPQEFREIENE